jgi:uncharacterized RDD family membrane protein YckC
VELEGPVAGVAHRGPGQAAEPGQRLAARIIDTLVVGLPVVLIARSALPQVTAETAASVGVGVFSLIYESVQLALWGRTLGKRLTGIEVVPAGPGGPPGPRPPESGGLGVRQALLRSAVYAVPIAARPVPILGVIAGMLWVANAAALFQRPRRQALHDRAARTFVVRSGL